MDEQDLSQFQTSSRRSIRVLAKQRQPAPAPVAPMPAAVALVPTAAAAAPVPAAAAPSPAAAAPIPAAAVPTLPAAAPARTDATPEPVSDDSVAQHDSDADSKRIKRKASQEHLESIRAPRKKISASRPSEELSVAQSAASARQPAQFFGRSNEGESAENSALEVTPVSASRPSKESSTAQSAASARQPARFSARLNKRGSAENSALEVTPISASRAGEELSATQSAASARQPADLFERLSQRGSARKSLIVKLPVLRRSGRARKPPTKLGDDDDPGAADAVGTLDSGTPAQYPTPDSSLETITRTETPAPSDPSSPLTSLFSSPMQDLDVSAFSIMANGPERARMPAAGARVSESASESVEAVSAFTITANGTERAHMAAAAARDAEIAQLVSADDLLKISQLMTYREPLGSKPDALGKPDVWSVGRQELCETLPYFKSPQSGCHTNDHHVYAFLFDGVGKGREYMDTDLIIARVGGGMGAVKGGPMAANKDKTMTDSQVQAVLNDIQYQNPIVIICGSKNAGTRFKMPHRYCVLGWYKPISVWAEKVTGKGGKLYNTVKYRLERMDPGTGPAWYDSGRPLLPAIERQIVNQLAVHRQTCQDCGDQHPQIYLVGWMCLNADCDQFWTLFDGTMAGTDHLDFHPAFLAERTTWVNEHGPHTAKPILPKFGEVTADNLLYVNTRGLCCPICGRCSARRKFRGWECENPGCLFNSNPAHMPVLAQNLHNPWSRIGKGPGLARNKHENHVKLSLGHIYRYKVCRYKFEGVKGCLIHAISNATHHEERGGADDMFVAMQNQADPAMDMGLQRRPFGKNDAPNKVGSASQQFETEETMDNMLTDVLFDDRTLVSGYLGGQGLMTAFSANFGMPYKFGTKMDSKSFDEAPWMIRAARADLNWASEVLLEGKHDQYNELLALAYMDGQKIDYHDDGETGLGPRVATMSLGGQATMTLRQKKKYYNGCSEKKVWTPERPLPGGVNLEDGEPTTDAKRLEAWYELESLRGNKAKYDERAKEVVAELGITGTKKAPDCVTLMLNHGDIVIMEGAEIQKYFEHKVVSEDCLRFALTCRTILEDHLKQDEKPTFEVGPDEEHMSALRRMAAREDAGLAL